MKRRHSEPPCPFRQQVSDVKLQETQVASMWKKKKQERGQKFRSQFCDPGRSERADTLVTEQSTTTTTATTITSLHPTMVTTIATTITTTPITGTTATITAAENASTATSTTASTTTPTAATNSTDITATTVSDTSTNSTDTIATDTTGTTQPTTVTSSITTDTTTDTTTATIDNKNRSTRKLSVGPVVIPQLTQEDLQHLCNLSPIIPDNISTIKLDKNRSDFKNFFRGINRSSDNPESRETYNLEVYKAIGVGKCLGNLNKINPMENVTYNYADGNLCVSVLRQAVPRDLTGHLLRTALALSPTFRHCPTRNVSTLHLGPKEFNPGKNQRAFYNGKQRVWTLDKDVIAEHVLALLPELIFADKILAKMAPNTHKQCLTINALFRLATTAFTQMALNSSECTIHRDFCFGLDVLLYAGEWVGGALEIPQLDIMIELQPGDVVIMDSILFHHVQRKAGPRFSIVFFTKNHNEESQSGLKLEIDLATKWLSQPYLGQNIK